jgi:hypothetical protein
MFEKKEDKLFGYAFGDLDAHDAQVFEASLLKDEASAEEVKFLQSMKGDLASFRDIPEMQYSKERLRHAILGQGLKPSRPGFPWLNWILAPGAAACVLALGYVMMNGTSRKDPTLIGTPMIASNPGVGLKLPEQKLEKPAPIVATKSEPKSGEMQWTSISDRFPKVTRFVEQGPRKSRRQQSKENRKESPMLAVNTGLKTPIYKASDSVKSSVAVTGGAGVAGSGGAGSPTAIMEATMKSEPTASLDAAMIMIDKDQDSGVGAPVATEVNDTKNVIIGG